MSARRSIAAANISPPIKEPRLAVAYWPIEKLKPYVRNPRKNDAAVDRMAASIQEFGFTIPVLVRSSGEVIDGHLRLKAAVRLAIPEIPVILCDGWTEAQVKAFRLMVNRSVAWAQWDMEALAVEFNDLKALDFDLSLTGFDPSEYEIAVLPDEWQADEDAVPAALPFPVTRVGDVWILGMHRVMCGDCREFESMATLLDGQQANVVITSPPYASQRKYDESSGFKPISPGEYVDWFADVAANVRAFLAADGSFFLNIKEHCDDGERDLYVMDLVIAHRRQWGWLYRDEFIWKHSGFPGEYMYRHRNQFEPVFHFSAQHVIKHRPYAVGVKSDLIRDNRGGKRNGGGRMVATNTEGDVDAGKSLPFKSGIAQVGNVLEIAVNSESTGHKAAFPVGLPEFFIRAFSDGGDAVVDPFLGSGSTLVACEKTMRSCYGMELSPAYVDVIVARWQNLTGKEATLEGHGATFAHVKSGRQMGAEDAIKEEVISGR